MSIPRILFTAILCISGLARAATGTIDATASYAYSENAGFINFAPTDSSVSVSRTALSGYAWCEAAGWIKLGADAGGPYANTTRANWGVNVAYSANVPGGGTCSGYAWSENGGWINFAPTNGGVTVGADGAFDGFAWCETLGWIHFDKTSATTVKTLPLNHAPSVVSFPIVEALKAINVGQTTTFTASATDPDGDALTYTWNFGDGSTGTGASVTHTYSTAGTYHVSVSVSDGVASASTSMLVWITTPMTVSKVALKFIFNKTGGDSLAISGTLPLPVGFTPVSTPINVTIEGFSKDFTLDASGKSGTAFSIAGKYKNGALTTAGATFKLNLSKQTNLFTSLQPAGFPTGTATAQSVTLPVTITVGTNGYHADKTTIYSGIAGKSGTGK